MSAQSLVEQPQLDSVAANYSLRAAQLLSPVSITIFIVVWAVENLSPIYAGQSQSALPMVQDEQAASSTADKIGDSLINALAIVAGIVVMTFIIVLLYKFRCMKVLIAWLVVTAAMVFFFMFWVFLDLVCTRYQIPYDLITIAIVLWNIGVVGMISVFYFAHPRLNQIYLILISVLMGWTLTRLPEWSSWAILLFVAIYDIVAVLCPGGPLRLLLEAAQERGEPLPGFIYDSAETTDHARRPRQGPQRPAAVPPAPAAAATSTTTSLPAHGSVQTAATNHTGAQVAPPPASAVAVSAAPPPRAAAPEEQQLLDEEEEDSDEAIFLSNEPPSAFKLGLGDFIFYSLLVGRASTSSFVAWVACYCMVLMGLVGTLSSLLLWRGKLPALPALPISIFLGVATFFLSKYLEAPFVYYATTSPFFV